METRKASSLTVKGRRLLFQEIEMPTDDEVISLANRLHLAGVEYNKKRLASGR